MKRRIIALLLTAVMSFSLAACSGSKEKATEGGSEEQYVNTYLAADPTTLDPSLRSDSYSSDILMNCMESLIRVGQRDGEYTFVPGDAETWESDETGTVWTFHLGEDRKWSDGEPVTADQYVYSLQRTADPETGSPNSFFVSPIKNYAAISEGEMAPEELGVEAPDEHTLVITLENPMPSFLESTDASVFYPQRQEIVEQYGEQYGADFDKFVYNGPFKVTEWTHNSSIKIEKNENYWDAENVDLDYVTYQIMSDTAAIMNAYDAGQIDVIDISSQEALQKYQADNNNVYTQISGGSITFAFYNTEDKLFSNANIRKAFTMAVDQEKVNEIAFSGLREPLYGWIAPAISVGDTSMRSVAGDTLKEMRKETLANTTAKDILLEGMKELGLGDDPSTLDVTFSLAGTTDWFRTFGEYLQQMYKEALGVNIKIDFSEWGIFSDNVYSGNFQIGYMAWSAYYNDPYDMLSIHLTDFNQIATGWSDPEYDKLVLGASQEMDEDARMQMYIDAEQILLDANVMCPLATSVTHRFTKSFLHDKYAEYGQDNLYFTHEGWKNTYIEGR